MIDSLETFLDFGDDRALMSGWNNRHG